VNFICAGCGERHDNLPMAYRMQRPDINPKDKVFEFFRDGELCTVGDDHFILSNLELPYRDDALFVWTCWISLSDASLARIDERWESEGRENDQPAFGWFSSALPTYEPTTRLLKARVHQNPIGLRPWLELEPTDHPLALEQRNGISEERITAVYHALCD
jgi:hypothetical protein